MNVLLLVRSEIVAIFVVGFFVLYGKACAKYREGKDYFVGIAIMSLGHTVMGMVTEITVNSERVPALWNNFFHILFFTFALLFSLKYFEYVLSLILPRKDSRVFLYIAYMLLTVSIIIMIFAPIHYVQGNGTKYSAGLGATICYALGYILILLADLLIIIYHKKISTYAVLLLIPLSLITLMFMAIQIFIPEFLFSGCALSITTVGVFFVIENPIGKFQSRAFIDSATQIRNKNCFDHDVREKYMSTKRDMDLIYVLVDINGLKMVNDTYGHLEGDALIKVCSDMLVDVMQHAKRVYRIGGDEFAVVYIGQAEEIVKSEITKVYQQCQKLSKYNDYIISMSIGYSMLEADEDMMAVMKRADTKMYEEKNRYYKENGIERRKV